MLEVKPVARRIRSNVGVRPWVYGVISGHTEAVLYLSPHKLESHSGATLLSRPSAGTCVISGREAPCPTSRPTYHG